MRLVSRLCADSALSGTFHFALSCSISLVMKVLAHAYTKFQFDTAVFQIQLKRNQRISFALYLLE